MSSSTLEAQIAAARAYEALFVPALFEAWAPRVAGAATLVAGQRALDVACGTGVLAREARVRVGPAGYVAGLDPNPGMLTVAREMSPSVDWRQGTAESIPFPDASFDAVMSQFGLMFMEPEKAIREMLRVLKPGRQLVVAVWDTAENIPAYAAEISLVARIAGARAADALRAPFILGRPERLSGLFDKAGANAVTISTQRGAAHFPSIRMMVEADVRGWLPVMGVSLGEEEIGRILEQAEDDLAGYAGSGGAVTFDMSAHLVTASRP
jgi:ubiquinone/menaquinone biosynthesis C-methylase UbiE